ncbi:enoyl-CoA hydratase-related protein [Sinisalibacter aestuarii]|uniref:2-(1,2-epoxy-1,2-dihydrophenyl)acetyl-CoA isomerase n=1 Tax=Sinisalibacter aestuarii TaxID=2949426 RepID=A0ABQ5LTC7_9RHOB|nr:enoyl-CoA hydratase-related protein [Sinisalibacter aestuarii]GKY87521.1 2-(1,2-epoxy-1,2-dihydrophenyl)acetyl-CoA isomerase [Sinisalibacter aestuarii]
MDYETIRLDIDNGLALMTLNRPEKMNALNTQMRAEMAHAVRHADEVARVLAITGEGRAFCTGQDLGDRASAGEVDLERTLRDEYEPVLRAITGAGIPVIAAVNGPAAGAGANLALAADVVIASQSAYFLQAFSRIGLIPDAGGTYTMPRAMGLAKAMGAALFAEKISADEASAMGLIWESVPDDDFDSHWRARARQLAEGPTLSYKSIKRLMRASLGNSFDDQIALEARMQGQCGRSRDFREGVMAFLEKRAPKFEGR